MGRIDWQRRAALLDVDWLDRRLAFMHGCRLGSPPDPADQVTLGRSLNAPCLA